MQHQGGPQFHGQVGKAASELVSDRIESSRVLDHEDRPDAALDLGAASLGAGLAVALPDQQPMQPGFEAVGIAERREVTPADEQGLLRGIFGPDSVMEEPSLEPPGPAASDLRSGTAYPAVLRGYGASGGRMVQ
jgi:hypothetical protein